MAMPATSVIRRSSGGRRGAALISSGAARRSRTSRRTERRSRSTVQLLALVVEHADHVAPAVLRPHPLDRRQEARSGGDEVAEIDAISRRGDRSDRLAALFAQPGIAGQPAARLGRLDAGLRALGNQRPLELSDGAEHLQGKHALRRRGVDRIAQGSKMRAALLERFDDLQQMADRARQPVEADDDEHLAALDLANELGEHRPGARGAGAMLLVNDCAAGGAQLVELGVGRLLLGRDAGVADEAAGGSEWGRGWRHGSNRGGFRGSCTLPTAVSNRPVAGVFYRPILRARKA